jgi:hypothetical protein
MAHRRSVLQGYVYPPALAKTSWVIGILGEVIPFASVCARLMAENAAA